MKCHFVSWILFVLCEKNCVLWIHILFCKLILILQYDFVCYEPIVWPINLYCMLWIHIVSCKTILGLMNPYCILWAHIGSLKWYCTLSVQQNHSFSWNNSGSKIDELVMNCFSKLLNNIKPYFRPCPLSEVLRNSNLLQVVNRIRTCTEPELMLCWMKMFSSECPLDHGIKLIHKADYYLIWCNISSSGKILFHEIYGEFRKYNLKW